MIQAAIIVMTVLGCGDQAKSCDIIPGPQVEWQSQAKCEAAITDALQRTQNAPYPMITAQCAPKAPLVAAAQPEPQAPAPLPLSTPTPTLVVQQPDEPRGITGTVIDTAKTGYAYVSTGAVSAAQGLGNGAAWTYDGVTGGVRSGIQRAMGLLGTE